MHIVAINIIEKKGALKVSIPQGNFIEEFGLEGDHHAGKLNRQVSLMGIESIEKMKALGIEGLCTAKFAENLTTEGVVLYELPLGTRIRIGETLQEVTQIGKECHQKCPLFNTIGDCIMPKEGIFTRVLKGGIIKVGDVIEVIDQERL